MRRGALTISCSHNHNHTGGPSLSRRRFFGHMMHLGMAAAAATLLDRSLIFQQPSLYAWLSALDNVAFGLMLQGVGRKGRHERAAQFPRQVGRREFPHKDLHKLSGGMQQRAAIARALCLGADVLLIDDPFATLDVQTRF